MSLANSDLTSKIVPVIPNAITERAGVPLKDRGAFSPIRHNLDHLLIMATQDRKLSRYSSPSMAVVF